MMLKQDPTL
jgi:26S proteasome regulatory subunit T1